MIFYLFLIIIIILVSKHIYEIHNYNPVFSIESLQSANNEIISEKIKERNPLLIHNLSNKSNLLRDLSFEKLIKDNPGHIILDNKKYISLKSFVDPESEQMNIYKNRDIVSQFRLTPAYDEIYNSFYSPIHCNKNYYLNLLKGNNAIALKCNKHNLMLIYQIHGESKLYLFNPSHRVNIMDKPNDQIKKYGHKINLKPGIVIMIPIEWYYFYESNGSSIVGEIESDNYFTVLYNNLR